MVLPPGCSVTYDLRVVEILRDLLRPKSGMEDLEAQYRDFRLRHGRRPRAVEVSGMGSDPSRNGHGGWFDFVRDMGDPVDERALATVGGLLRRVERDQSLNPPALEALRRLSDHGRVSAEARAVWAFEPLLALESDYLRLTRPDPDGSAAGMLAELAEWRLATVQDRQAAEAPAAFSGMSIGTQS